MYVIWCQFMSHTVHHISRIIHPASHNVVRPMRKTEPTARPGHSLRPDLSSLAAAAGGLGVAMSSRPSRPSRPSRAACRASRRQLVAAGPLGLAVASAPALAASEPPTVMKKIADGVHIFDQAYGIPGLEVGGKLRSSWGSASKNGK